MSQTILVIDDSPDIHKLLEARLRPEGVVLHHALDAQDGIKKMRDLHPDLVLLDVDMPDVTGFDVCQTLKSDPDTASTPIIFLTAASDIYDKIRGFDLGAVDYVTKPFDAAELRARVRAALRTKRYQDLLSARSEIDALTGLWNRGYFDKRLEEELAANHRYGRKVSLVMFDIDKFKDLNDGHGHPFGDRVLERVGEVMLGSLRATDAPCRYGGDEFAVILTETTITGAVGTAERLRARMAGLIFPVGGLRILVTASFGVAGTDAFATSPSPKALLASADDVLYAAKREGRDCVRATADREAATIR